MNTNITEQEVIEKTKSYIREIREFLDKAETADSITKLRNLELLHNFTYSIFLRG